MLRYSKERPLAIELYKTIDKNNKGGINRDCLKNHIFNIFHLNGSQKKPEAKDKFHTFYMNKMLYSTREVTTKEFPYAPSLNPNSIKLAEKSREKRRKMLNIEERNLTITDMLSIVKRKYDESNQKDNGGLYSSRSEKKLLGMNKSLSLYKLSRVAKKQVGKTTEELEYEKAKNDLTFTPRIAK